MAESTMLTKCKKALRINASITEYDEEITGLIASAERDIEVTGVTVDEDPIYTDAVICYVKANFGFNNPDRDDFMKRYTDMLKKMALIAEYIGNGGE